LGYGKINANDKMAIANPEKNRKKDEKSKKFLLEFPSQRDGLGAEFNTDF